MHYINFVDFTLQESTEIFTQYPATVSHPSAIQSFLLPLAIMKHRVMMTSRVTSYSHEVVIQAPGGREWPFSGSGRFAP